MLGLQIMLGLSVSDHLYNTYFKLTVPADETNEVRDFFFLSKNSLQTPG